MTLISALLILSDFRKSMAIDPSETNSRMSNEKEAKNWLGPMREATHEEQQSVEDYVKSISVNTGVKFF